MVRSIREEHKWNEIAPEIERAVVSPCLHPHKKLVGMLAVAVKQLAASSLLTYRFGQGTSDRSTRKMGLSVKCESLSTCLAPRSGLELKTD